MDTVILVVLLLGMFAVVLVPVALYLLREVLCWYWKFSEQVALLQAHREYLERIADSLEALEARSRPPVPAP